MCQTLLRLNVGTKVVFKYTFSHCSFTVMYEWSRAYVIDPIKHDSDKRVRHKAVLCLSALSSSAIAQYGQIPSLILKEWESAVSTILKESSQYNSRSQWSMSIYQGQYKLTLCRTHQHRSILHINTFTNNHKMKFIQSGSSGRQKL